jgi:hypothetical protein
MKRSVCLARLERHGTESGLVVSPASTMMAVSRCSSSQLLDDDEAAAARSGVGTAIWDGDMWVDKEAQQQISHILEVNVLRARAASSRVLSIKSAASCRSTCTHRLHGPATESV